jgi:hypothetical protein
MLSLKPQKIDEHNWYYEYKGHLLFVHETVSKLDPKEWYTTDQIKIPIRKIIKSLERNGYKISKH